jgi:hypothetical protein
MNGTMALGVRLVHYEGQLSSPQPELLPLHRVTGRNFFYRDNLPKVKPSATKDYCEAAMHEHGDQVHKRTEANLSASRPVSRR